METLFVSSFDPTCICTLLLDIYFIFYQTKAISAIKYHFPGGIISRTTVKCNEIDMNLFQFQLHLLCILKLLDPLVKHRYGFYAVYFFLTFFFLHGLL